MTLVLASGSKVRADLLRQAGLAFTVRPSPVDEEVLKAALKQRDPAPAELALGLAEGKALAQCGPGELVIGADQVLDCDGRLYDKPADLAAARRHLLSFRGRAHRLTSAVAVAAGGAVTWRCVATATLHVRAFSDAFLEDYLAQVGEAACKSVGAYQIEGPGLQLFERIDGDLFTIMGLPLLPLLRHLRDAGVLPQ